MLHCYHGFPRLSLSHTIRLYHPLFPACPYRAALNKFFLFWSTNTCMSVWRVHGRTLLMSLSLFLQQCPACFVYLIWVVLEMGGRWPYICCFMGCCFRDLLILENYRNKFSTCILIINKLFKKKKNLIDMTNSK